MHAVSKAEFTAASTAHILVNQYMVKHACPKRLLLDNGTVFCAEISRAIYKLMGIHELATTSFHPKWQMASSHSAGDSMQLCVICILHS